MPNENIQTEDLCKSELNGQRSPDQMNQDEKPDAFKDICQEAMMQIAEKPEPAVRLDRYGYEIIPRAQRLKSGIKSTHKVTYIDSIHKENSTSQ
jgi:hypothetical protein